MSKKIKVVTEKHGCLYWCLVLLLIAAAIAALGYAAGIAAGVGLWFLIRYVWRQYVSQRPDARFVKRGMAMAPITRKIVAAIPCVILSCSLIAAIYPAPHAKTEDTQSESVQATSEKPAANSSGEKSSGNSDSLSSPTSSTDNAASGIGTTASLRSMVEDRYNDHATYPFVEEGTFDPQDKSDSHYQTEFRLSAYKDAVGLYGTFGDCDAILVMEKNGHSRWYAFGTDREQMAQIFKDAVPVFSSTATAEEIDRAASAYLNDGDSPNFASIGDGLNGYLGGHGNEIEFMIETY